MYINRGFTGFLGWVLNVRYDKNDLIRFAVVLISIQKNQEIQIKVKPKVSIVLVYLTRGRNPLIHKELIVSECSNLENAGY